jgi:hypothetical protein
VHSSEKLIRLEKDFGENGVLNKDKEEKISTPNE